MWVESTTYNAAESLLRTMGLIAFPATQQKHLWGGGGKTRNQRTILHFILFSFLFAQFYFVFIHMICLIGLRVTSKTEMNAIENSSGRPQHPMAHWHSALSLGLASWGSQNLNLFLAGLPFWSVDTWLGGALCFCVCGLLSARQSGSLARGRFLAQSVTWLSVPVCSPPARRIYKTQWDEVLGFVTVTGANVSLLQKFLFKESSATNKINKCPRKPVIIPGATVLSEWDLTW